MSIEPKIYDDILNELEKDVAQQFFMNPTFPWYYNEAAVFESTETAAYIEANTRFKDDAFECPVFVHSFFRYDDGNVYKNSKFSDMPLELIEKFFQRANLPVAELMRIKANLHMPVNNDKKFNFPHVDCDDKHFVILYYINDSDGNTFLFDKNDKIIKEVTPKKGRFFMFDGRDRKSVV